MSVRRRNGRPALVNSRLIGDPTALSLRHTYELYLHQGDEPPRFEALTCADEVELLAAMRRLIAERSLSAVEAWRLGEQVMVLAG